MRSLKYLECNSTPLPH